MHNSFVIIQILCLHLFYVTSISNNKTTTPTTIPPPPPPPNETIESPTATADEENKQTDKRSLLIGDLSYSYAATDIGSPQGSHIKTITVIKNIAVPDPRDESYKSNLQHQHHHHHHHSNYSINNDGKKTAEWINNINNPQFKLFDKVPIIPEIPNVNFFGVDERPPTTIPTSSMRPIDQPEPVPAPPVSDQQRSGETDTNKENEGGKKEVVNVENDEQQKEQQQEEPEPQTLNDDVSINYKAQMDHIVKVAKQIKSYPTGEKLPEAMSYTKYSKPSDISTDNKQKLPPNDVELIQTGSPIGLEQAERSKQAQSRRLKELQKYNEGTTTKSNIEHGNSQYRQPQQHQQQQQMTKQHQQASDDFSKYSLHNVKLILDPLKRQQQYKYNSSPTISTERPLRSQQNQEQQQQQHQISTSFDQYGTKIGQKSQTYIDVSKNARKIYQNGEPIHPYVAPSIKRAYSTSSTTTQRPYVAPLKNRGPQTFYLIHEPVTSTQRPYLAPNVYKPYAINNDQQKFEELRLKSEREAIELEQQTQELQQLNEKNQQNKPILIPRNEKVLTPQHQQLMQQIKNEQLNDNNNNKDVEVLESSSSPHYEKLESPTKMEQLQNEKLQLIAENHTQQQSLQRPPTILRQPITHQEIKTIEQQQQLPTPMALSSVPSNLTATTTSSIESNKPKSRRSRQHRRHNKNRGGFIAIPLDISTKLPYANDDDDDGNLLSTQKIAAHLIRHPYVFDSSPPHSFLQSPFRPCARIP